MEFSATWSKTREACLTVFGNGLSSELHASQDVVDSFFGSRYQKTPVSRLKKDWSVRLRDIWSWLLEL